LAKNLQFPGESNFAANKCVTGIKWWVIKIVILSRMLQKMINFANIAGEVSFFVEYK